MHARAVEAAVERHVHHFGCLRRAAGAEKDEAEAANQTRVEAHCAPKCWTDGA